MTKVKCMITFTDEYELDPELYPEGSNIQDMIAIDMASAQKDPITFCNDMPCEIDIKVNNSVSLKELINEFFSILEETEVSDSGTEFHPTTINSCRVFKTQRLGELIAAIKEQL